MWGEWKETTLGDVVELKRGYDLPKKQRQAGDVPIISSAGISDTHLEAKVKGPGVVTGRYGTIGEVFYSACDFWPLNTTLYVRDFKSNDEKFIYYFLQTIDYQQYSDKAAVPGVNRNHLHMAEVKVPKSVDEQKSIAHILGTLDDKIELNRQMNATLEVMAQALFKSWFVDFDPVIDNALAAGNPISDELQARAEVRAALGDKRKPLPEAIQKKFPSSFVFSEEMGWIPEGWDIKKLDQLTNKITDGTHSTVKDNPEGDCYLLSCKNIKNGQILIGDSERRIDKDTLQNLRKRTNLSQHDVLITTVGTIGEVAMIRDPEIPYELQRSVGILKPDLKSITPEFLYQLVKSDRFIHEAEARSEGSVQKCLFLGAIKAIEVITPPIELLRLFDDYAISLYDKVEGSHRENNLLSKSRDTLLPKLLSGQLRIPDAEKLVAEVTA